MRMVLMKRFRPFLYWVLAIFLLIGLFYPWVGLAALLCMTAPVAVAFYRGRYWCGNFCPRGSLFDQVISKVSLKRPIPGWMRTNAFRYFTLAFIMTLFSIQIFWAWGDWAAVGGVFLRVIFLTTIVGVLLGITFNQRTWCASVCPMGTLANLAAKSKR